MNEKEAKAAQKAEDKARRDAALVELSALIDGLTKPQQEGVKALLTWHAQQQEGDNALYLKKTGQVLKAAHAKYNA